MAIYHSLPGQEQRNADMILEGGAGFKVSDSKMLAYKLNKVLKDKASLKYMKERQEAWQCDAADAVAAYVRGSFRT